MTTVSIYGNEMSLSELGAKAKKLGLNTGRIEKLNKINIEVHTLRQASEAHRSRRVKTV
ncbi:MAG: hypothetical protein U9P37_06920 [Pseudomonadota bacterium]|nr:hypothetical protein [Pseudomonadota bacterium]